MSLLQQIQELAVQTKYQPYIYYGDISFIEILEPVKIKNPEECEGFKYQFNNFKINGYSQSINVNYPFSIKVILSNGSEWFITGKKAVEIAKYFEIIPDLLYQELSADL